MNNPVRALLQKHFESEIFKKLGGATNGLDVLEIGCGRGVGTELILKNFGAKSVIAIDLDEEMVAKAKRRLQDPRVEVKVASAIEIPLLDQSVSAVFDFGIIHHIPDWQKAIFEIVRVLKPGGRFYFEEVSKKALDSWAYKTFLRHPTENRFTLTEFTQELETSGLALVAEPVEVFFDHFFFGVAEKT